MHYYSGTVINLIPNTWSAIQTRKIFLPLPPTPRFPSPEVTTLGTFCVSSDKLPYSSFSTEWPASFLNSTVRLPHQQIQIPESMLLFIFF